MMIVSFDSSENVSFFCTVGRACGKKIGPWEERVGEFFLIVADDISEVGRFDNHRGV